MRTGNAKIIENDRLRKELKQETEYDFQNKITRGTFIENLIGYYNQSDVVEFPQEYIGSVGYFKSGNPYKDRYENLKPDALLPTIKPTMVEVGLLGQIRVQLCFWRDIIFVILDFALTPFPCVMGIPVVRCGDGNTSNRQGLL